MFSIVHLVYADKCVFRSHNIDMDTTTKTFVILASIVVIAAGAVRPAIQVINNYVERQQTIKLKNDLGKQLLIEKEVCLSEVETLRKNPDPDMSQWEYEEYLDRLAQGC